MRLIPAQFVKPFVKSNKNDFLDAEAIAEAVARQNMRFVPIKIDDQLDLQAIHRVRYRPRLRRSRLHQSPSAPARNVSAVSARECPRVAERRREVGDRDPRWKHEFRENPDNKSACVDRLFKHLRMAFGLHW